jgi:hypothetical protein
MMTPKTQTIVASTAITLSIAVSLALIPMKPDGSSVVIGTMIAFVIVWNVVKMMTKRKCDDWINSKTRHEILFAISLASLLCLGSISATLAKELGLFDGDLTKRIIGVNMGLMLMVMGNYMPKKPASSCSSCADNSKKSQDTQRFVGWTLAIGGLLYALVWLFVDLNKASLAVLFTFPVAIVIVFFFRFAFLRGSKSVPNTNPTESV